MAHSKGLRWLLKTPQMGEIDPECVNRLAGQRSKSRRKVEIAGQAVNTETRNPKGKLSPLCQNYLSPCRIERTGNPGRKKPTGSPEERAEGEKDAKSPGGDRLPEQNLTRDALTIEKWSPSPRKLKGEGAGRGSISSQNVSTDRCRRQSGSLPPQAVKNNFSIVQKPRNMTSAETDTTTTSTIGMVKGNSRPQSFGIYLVWNLWGLSMRISALVSGDKDRHAKSRGSQ